jgi:hypothetical protein
MWVLAPLWRIKRSDESGVGLALITAWELGQSGSAEEASVSDMAASSGSSHATPIFRPQQKRYGDTGRRAGNISRDIPQCWPMSLGTGVPTRPEALCATSRRDQEPSSSNKARRMSCGECFGKT